MSVAELYSLEAQFNTGKKAYKSALNQVHHGQGKQSKHPAAQMNVDLQTLLLQMSNILSPTSVEQFQLLKASDVLQDEYKQLEDAQVLTTQYKYQYIAWALTALLILYMTLRGGIGPIYFILGLFKSIWNFIATFFSNLFQASSDSINSSIESTANWKLRE
jgi:hypothetical protein